MPTSLPVRLSANSTASGRQYRLRRSDKLGRLEAWDSEDGGLCDCDSTQDPFISISQRCIAVVSGPPFTAFEFSVVNFRTDSEGPGTVPTPDLFFTLYGGSGTSAVKLIEALWTPGSFNQDSMIFQIGGILMTDVYIFCQTDGAGAAVRSRIGMKFLASRSVALTWFGFGAPSVAIAGPFP